MKPKSYLKLILFLIILNLSTVKADDEEDEDRPRSCQKFVYDFLYGIVQSTLKCLGGQSYFKLNHIFELTTRASCLLKCILQEEGIIDPTGVFDDIGAALYFEAKFDQPVRDITLPEAQPCFELAGQFRPNEYWCKSYLAFIECSFRAILKGLVPYIGDCISNPIVGILFSTISYLAPDSPKLAEEADELRRSMGKNISPIRCLDSNCTKRYEYKKINGTGSIILYDKDMNVVSIESRKNKSKPNQVSNDNNKYTFKGFNTNFNSKYKANFTYNYN